MSVVEKNDILILEEYCENLKKYHSQIKKILQKYYSLFEDHFSGMYERYSVGSLPYIEMIRSLEDILRINGGIEQQANKKNINQLKDLHRNVISVNNEIDNIVRKYSNFLVENYPDFYNKILSKTVSCTSILQLLKSHCKD